MIQKSKTNTSNMSNHHMTQHKQEKFKRRTTYLKRNKSLPNLKRLQKLTETNFKHQNNQEKYYQWKDKKYFEYIVSLLEVVID